jgi:hypothetical protein
MLLLLLIGFARKVDSARKVMPKTYFTCKALIIKTCISLLVISPILIYELVEFR